MAACGRPGIGRDPRGHRLGARHIGCRPARGQHPCSGAAARAERRVARRRAHGHLRCGLWPRHARAAAGDHARSACGRLRCGGIGVCRGAQDRGGVRLTNRRETAGTGSGADAGPLGDRPSGDTFPVRPGQWPGRATEGRRNAAHAGIGVTTAHRGLYSPGPGRCTVWPARGCGGSRVWPLAHAPLAWTHGRQLRRRLRARRSHGVAERCALRPGLGLTRAPILFATAPDRGKAFAGRWAGKRPTFCCVLAHTDTCLIPGVSAAGISEELRPYTPAADAEVVLLGAPRCLPRLPSNPLGAAGPSGITRAALQLTGIEAVFIGAGLRVWPETQCERVDAAPGGNIECGHAVPHAARLLDEGLEIGRTLTAAAPYLVLADSVPGGTTTRPALLVP